jgi:hypothetical protein
VLLIKYNWNDQVKEDEIGRAYSTHGERSFDRGATRKETSRKIQT